MKFKIYRDARDIKWTCTLAEFESYAKSASQNLRWSLVGKHGFGKSSILEYVSWHSKLKVLPGDMLVTYLSAMTDHLDRNTKLCDVPFPNERVRDAVIMRSWTEMINRAAFSWDLSEGNYPWTEHAALVLPKYEFYVTNLKRRTRQMLKDPKWAGYDQSHWPVLSREEFQEYIDSKLRKSTELVIPNYPESDAPFAYLVDLLEGSNVKTRG